MFYLPSYVKMQDMNEKNHAFAKRISDLERENTRLDEERRRLTDDPVYFEKVAREKMGIIKDGEVLYKILGPGEKKDGVNSDETSFIIKQADDDADNKPNAVVKPAVKSKAASTKPSAKKKNKTSSTAVKKKSTVSTSQATTQSTKE